MTEVETFLIDEITKIKDRISNHPITQEARVAKTSLTELLEISEGMIYNRDMDTTPISDEEVRFYKKYLL